MVYDFSSDEAYEFLLPNVFVPGDREDPNYLEMEDPFVGLTTYEILDKMKLEMEKSSETLVSLSTLKEDKEKIGYDATREIHIPDDPRIKEVEIILYTGNHAPVSRLMQLVMAKLNTCFNFGKRDMSTVKRTVL